MVLGIKNYIFTRMKIWDFQGNKHLWTHQLYVDLLKLMQSQGIRLEGSSSNGEQVLAEDLFCYFVIMLWNKYTLIHLNM